jgi:hypothetical protein
MNEETRPGSAAANFSCAPPSAATTANAASSILPESAETNKVYTHHELEALREAVAVYSARQLIFFRCFLSRSRTGLGANSVREWDDLVR